MHKQRGFLKIPAFNIEPYHKTILDQLEGLDMTQSGSVAVAQFAAGMLSMTAVPPESLPVLIAGVDDLIRRMTESQTSFASRAASFLQVGVGSLKQRLGTTTDRDGGLLTATGHGGSGRRPDAHRGDGDDSDIFASGHGKQQIGRPITVTDARGMPDRHLGGGGYASGCPFAAGRAAHVRRHVVAPDPDTVVVRGLGRSGGDVAGSASHSGQ